MNESLKNENSIREYLLGRVSDEDLLAEYEELLFLDEEFCALAEMVEDDLVNDFVFERLNAADRADFLKTLERNRERQTKIALAGALKEKAKTLKINEKKTNPSFFDALKAFFQKPLNVGAFAVALVGILTFSIYFLTRPSNNDLAELRAIYKQDRPTETRLSEFDYAPLSVTRGAAEEREKSKLRRIENNLLESVEKNPSAQTHHALGVFRLTQRKFDEAIKELEKAAKLDEKNATIRNDLGSAYFEKAKTEPDEKRLETLAKALENFSAAFEADKNFLPSLFNKALCQQEIPLYNEAKAAWNLYLEKDKNSGWAEEARKNLERLEQLKTTSKTKEQVLEDFLAAYRNRDEEMIWKINSTTREMISGVWLPDQLSRRFLEAKIRGDDAAAAESIEALKFIGNLEKTRNADFFVAEMSNFYAATEKFEDLLKAENMMQKAFEDLTNSEYESALDKFYEVKRIFHQTGNSVKENLAEHWIAFSETNQGKIGQSNKRLNELGKKCEEKNYKWLRAIVLMRLGINAYRENNQSKAIELGEQSIGLFENISDYYNLSRLYGDQAISLNYIGENRKALAYLSKNLFRGELYFKSDKQKLRDLGNITDTLSAGNYKYSAISFGTEQLTLTEMQNEGAELIFDSLIILSISYTKIGKYDDALRLAGKAMTIAESFADKSSQKLKIAYSARYIGHINRLAGNCGEALNQYDLALGIYADTPENSVWNYDSHKGKLLCFQQLEQPQNLQNELSILRNLLEKYRSQIIEEQNRNVFFDKEQSVLEIAVDAELANNNPVRGFEIYEETKARSLLDFMQGNASFEKSEIRFAGVTKNLSLTEIQRRMPSAAQIVEYAVLPDKTAVWLIQKDSIEYFEIALKNEFLQRKTDEFLQNLIDEKTASERTKNLSNELYESLIAPLFSRLDRQKQICFVPDKSLSRLPFAALFSREKKKYLIEDFSISYAPSASIFVIASENAEEKEFIKDESLLIVGNPKFDMAENPDLSELPAAETEAKEIAAIYRTNRLLNGAAATKSNILSYLPDKNIFHFAGHYVTNEASTPNSKLLLAKQAENDDLRLFEIAELHLSKTKLVVLSACQTNAEKIYQGEGATGIARTFLAVGSPAVLASVWKVESEATKDLMIGFHQNRRKGLKSAEALRAAQIEMLKNENVRFSAPYFWAAFSLVGGFTNY